MNINNTLVEIWLPYIRNLTFHWIHFYISSNNPQIVSNINTITTGRKFTEIQNKTPHYSISMISVSSILQILQEWKKYQERNEKVSKDWQYILHITNKHQVKCTSTIVLRIQRWNMICERILRETQAKLLWQWEAILGTHTIHDLAFGKATSSKKIYPRNHEYNDENCLHWSEAIQNWIT